MNKILKWDIRFLELAKLISTWSKDPSTQVGAVITNGIKVVSIGYNGLPASVRDDPELLNNREEKYKYIIHGEMNAILTAKCDLSGCTLYTYPFLPCTNCASMTIQTGIKRVVAPICQNDRWRDRLEQSKDIFNRANIEVVELDVYI